jgi:hypothetical protein
MTINDKRNLLDYVAQHHHEESFEIELGCGNRKRSANAIGIDQLDYPGVDIVGDIAEVLARFPENSIATIRSFHVLEHLENFGDIVQQLETVLKVGGHLQIVVPHFSNPHYYSDYTHKGFFGLYSLSYLSRDEILRRKVPTYGKHSALVLEDVRLGFKSSPPFYLKHAFKLLLTKVVNSCRYFQESYEELFCWIAPCYEIDYRLTKQLPLKNQMEG